MTDSCREAGQELEARTRPEVLPPARRVDDEPAAVQMTNKEAWALWDYFQGDGPPYWEHGLAGLGYKLKEWVITEAPWGEEEPGDAVELRRR